MDNTEVLNTLLSNARTAVNEFESCTQEQVDALIRRVCLDFKAHAEELAREAVEETGMGNVESKIAKNRGAKKSTLHTVQIINDSLAAMGAPKNLVQCIEESSIHRQQALSAD